MTWSWNNSMRAFLATIMIALAASSASAAEIRVMAAGSLKDAFTSVFADYTKRYGGGFAAVWGPSGVLRERLQNGEAFDVFASAALPHAQTLTDAGVSRPRGLFSPKQPWIVAPADCRLDARKPIQ